MAEHGHAEGHIVLAIDQGYRSSARAATHSARSSEAIYNPPGIVHRDHFDELGSRFLAISIPIELSLDRRDAFVIQSAQAHASLSRMIGRCLSWQSGSALAAEDQLLKLLGDLACERALPISHPRWMARALESMEEMTVDPRVTIRQVARSADVHPVHLARVHRAMFGFGPAERIRRGRAARAVALLDRPESLASIAMACGYADQSHMCRELSSRIGISPARLRQSFAR